MAFGHVVFLTNLPRHDQADTMVECTFALRWLDRGDAIKQRVALLARRRIGRFIGKIALQITEMPFQKGRARNGAGGWIGLAMISLLALGMSTALALGPNQDHDVLVMDR